MKNKPLLIIVVCFVTFITIYNFFPDLFTERHLNAPSNYAVAKIIYNETQDLSLSDLSIEFSKNNESASVNDYILKATAENHSMLDRDFGVEIYVNSKGFGFLFGGASSVAQRYFLPANEICEITTEFPIPLAREYEITLKFAELPPQKINGSNRMLYLPGDANIFSSTMLVLNKGAIKGL